MINLGMIWDSQQFTEQEQIRIEGSTAGNAIDWANFKRFRKKVNYQKKHA